MEQLLQEFESRVADKSGTIYRVFLYGRSRPSDTWQGWLVFERATDGQRFSTDVETTQPNAPAVLYWATGLTDAYFDGALDRALHPHRHDASAVPTPAPIVSGDSATRLYRLGVLERAILDCFRKHGARRLLMRTFAEELGYAHADVVRALEDLEKRGRMIVRETQEGNDWVFLTEAGELAVRPGGADEQRQPG